MQLNSDEIANIIKDQIKNYSEKTSLLDIGTVISVGDGIANIYGLEDCMSGELLEFEDGTNAMALNLEEDTIGAIILGSCDNIKEGATVLDCFMGSGSTGVACLQTKRNFIGIELDENYYNIAKERCSEYQSKLW